jgi:DNA polymerase III delta subunit
MKFSEFKKHTPRPSHVYVFVCEDDFLVEEAKPVWIRIFEGEWDFEKMSVKEFESIESNDLMGVALTPPLFGSNRAMLVTDGTKVSKKRLEDLSRLAELEASSLKIVLVVSSRRALKAGLKGFPRIELDAMRPADTAKWIRDRYSVTPEVARHLVENVGSELYVLHSELEKLKTYVRDERPVEVADVDVLILRSEQFGPFELDDALLARDYEKAVRVVGAMIEDGVSHILILSRLVRVWRQIFVGKALEGRGSAKEIAAAASVPHWKAGDFVTSCRRFEWTRVVDGFTDLVQADRAFKSSSPNPEYYFDIMLWKLIR